MKTKTGTELIAEERQRQISQEGWTPEHDDGHDLGQIAGAAACYALQSCGFLNPHLIEAPRGLEPDGEIALWPWSLAHWKPKDRLSNLVRAGALIAAEIDRLQRLQAPQPA